MEALTIQVGRSARGVVDVPEAVDVVQLRSPDVAAPRSSRILVNCLGGPSLEAVQGGSPGDLEVGPGRGHEVVVATRVDDVGIRAIDCFQRVGVGSSTDEAGGGEEPEEDGLEELHG